MADNKDMSIGAAHEAEHIQPDIHTAQIESAVFAEKVPEKHDDALDFLRSKVERDFVYTDEEAKRVRWKIDLFLMPMVRLSFTSTVQCLTCNSCS